MLAFWFLSLLTNSLNAAKSHWRAIWWFAIHGHMRPLAVDDGQMTDTIFALSKLRKIDLLWWSMISILWNNNKPISPGVLGNDRFLGGHKDPKPQKRNLSNHYEYHAVSWGQWYEQLIKMILIFWEIFETAKIHQSYNRKVKMDNL